MKLQYRICRSVSTKKNRNHHFLLYIIATSNTNALWDRVSGLGCHDPKITWKLQSSFIQALVPQSDAPLTDLFKCLELPKFLRWYTPIRRIEGPKLGREFPEMEQLSIRVKDLAKNVITGSILLDEMEVIFTRELGQGHHNLSFSVNKHILGYFKDCDSQPDNELLQNAGRELALLRFDLASITLILNLSLSSPNHYFY